MQISTFYLSIHHNLYFVYVNLYDNVIEYPILMFATTSVLRPKKSVYHTKNVCKQYTGMDIQFRGGN